MNAFKLITISAAIAVGSSVFAQKTFTQVTAEAAKELRAAEKELADLRNQIADEKIPISQQLTKLESEVQTQRKEYDRVVRAAENRSVDLNTLQDKVKAQSDQNIYLKNLLSAYIKQFSTRLDASEFQTYSDLTDEAENIMQRADADDADRLAAQVKVLSASIDRLNDLVGGHTFPGSALDKSGKEIQGNYVLTGPFGFFGDGGENVGFSKGEINSLLPRIIDKGVDPKFVAAIKGLTSNGTGDLPIDPTEGDAFKLSLTKETAWEHIKKGGLTMVPLLGIAGIALIIGIFKIFEVNSVKSPKAGQLQQILDSINANNKQKALEIANSVDGPFGDLLTQAVEHANQEKELLEEVLYERILAAQPKLERFIAFIALTAAAAPLLGLLGTVSGMINTFKLITVFGTGDAASLSSGISEALITTEYGLYVAIPALIGQALLSRLAKGKLGEMEQASVAFVNGIASRK